MKANGEKAPAEVLFVPDWRGGNPYQELLASAVSATGLTVGFANYPESEFPLLTLAKGHPSARVIHLHWINFYLNRIFWSGNWFKARLRALLMMLDILLVRARGVKVIWTVHNLLTHESADPEREKMARRALARAATRLVFHSAEAREMVEAMLGMPLAKRSVVIPHGNYLGMYPSNSLRERQLRARFGLRDGETVILFFGGLRRYKGVGQLLGAFRQTTDRRLRLIIAGRPFEQDLAENIEQAAAADPRICAYLGHIPEEDVGPLYAISDLAIVPFERTLSSGSVVLALSQAKALLLPEEARVLGVPDTRGIVFFGDAKELPAVLENLPDRCGLQAMGLVNLEVAKALDWSGIGRKTAFAYAERTF